MILDKPQYLLHPSRATLWHSQEPDIIVIDRKALYPGKVKAGREDEANLSESDKVAILVAWKQSSDLFLLFCREGLP